FLAVTCDSAFQVKTKQARTWRITAERCNDQPATKDFMRWRPRSKKDASAAPENLKHGPSTGTDSPSTRTRAIKLPVSVPPQGLTAHLPTGSQPLHRDIYNIPGEGAFIEGAAGHDGTEPEAAPTDPAAPKGWLH